MDSSYTIVIDRGNSVASKIAFFKGGEVLRTESGVSKDLRESIRSSKVFGICRGAVYSSVGKPDEEFEQWLQEQPFHTCFLNKELPEWVKEKHGLAEALGCDRVAVIVGACNRYAGHPLLIVDSGTAITYDMVDKDGKRTGGLISAGIRLRLAALHQHTALLPEIAEEGEMPPVGYDTETEMRSGAIWGAVREMAHAMEEARRQDPKLMIMLTGGNSTVLSRTLKQITDVPFETDSMLVLKGLNVIANHDETTK